MDLLFFRLWSLIPDTTKPMVIWVLCPSNRRSTGSNLILSRLPNSCGAKGKPRTTTHKRILAYLGFASLYALGFRNWGETGWKAFWTWIICRQWSEVFALNAAEWDAAIGTLRDLRTDNSESSESSESSKSKSWLRRWNRDFFTARNPPQTRISSFSLPGASRMWGARIGYALCPHHQPSWAVMSRNKLVELFEVQHSTTTIVSGWVVWLLFLWAFWSILNVKLRKFLCSREAMELFNALSFVPVWAI